MVFWDFIWKLLHLNAQAFIFSIDYRPERSSNAQPCAHAQLLWSSSLAVMHFSVGVLQSSQEGENASMHARQVASRRCGVMACSVDRTVLLSCFQLGGTVKSLCFSVHNLAQNLHRQGGKTGTCSATTPLKALILTPLCTCSLPPDIAIPLFSNSIWKACNGKRFLECPLLSPSYLHPVMIFKTQLKNHLKNSFLTTLLNTNPRYW